MESVLSNGLAKVRNCNNLDISLSRLPNIPQVYVMFQASSDQVTEGKDSFHTVPS